MDNLDEMQKKFKEIMKITSNHAEAASFLMLYSELQNITAEIKGFNDNFKEAISDKS